MCACVCVSTMRMSRIYVFILLNAHTQCQAKILSPLLLKLLLFRRRRRRCRRRRLLWRFFFRISSFDSFPFWLYVYLFFQCLAFLCHCILFTMNVELCWTSSSFSSELNIFYFFISSFIFPFFFTKKTTFYTLIFTKSICFRK